MTTLNKRRGRDAEIQFLDWARANLGPAERLRLTGRNDEGDVAVTVNGVTYVVECKNVERAEFPQFVRESEVEAVNYANKRGFNAAQDIFLTGLPGPVARPLVVMKKRGTRDVGEWFALTTVKNFPW